ncbi:hypothetical protein GIB67_026999 [Kingdonia uniflora]|uniref:Cation/H+ exchanger domain-containing protein n=1 Tax=Kingdonia uniflora TaxID=39325 RepID=A0A7J7P297_9MAGN|nr:hypothetical protein GIB67_026999 [Kingdonia uniflora]
MEENFTFGTNLERAYADGETYERKIYCLAIDTPSIGDNPLSYIITLFLIDLILVTVVIRILVFLFEYLRQPRIVAEIIGGVILGPSLMGMHKKYWATIFPAWSLLSLQPMAQMGIIFYVFLLGVEMNLSALRRIGRKSIFIALTSVILPFLAAGLATFSLKNITVFRPINREYSSMAQFLYLGVAFTVTAFSTIARILTELKLLTTDHGKAALSSAILADLCSWLLLFITMAITNIGNSLNIKVVPEKTLIYGVVYIFIFIFLIHPGIIYLLEFNSDGDHIENSFIIFILTGVIFSGFMTDAIGVHPIFGAFMFGLTIPSGPLQVAIVEKLEDYVSGILLPLYFVINGLRTNIWIFNYEHKHWKYLLGVIVAIFVAKVSAILCIAMLQNMKAHDGAIVGLLLNTKGLLGIIILNIARDQKIFDGESFTIMIIAMVATTTIIVPLVTRISRFTKGFTIYKNRTFQKLQTNAELRVLVCIHNRRNVPPIVKLLEISNPTVASPMGVYALHLVELTGRASAMLVVHNTKNSNHVALNRTQAQSEHIVNAFHNYEQNTHGVFVQTLTAISPYSTVHEDICNIAEDKRVTFIVIPFHKERTFDGNMEVVNADFQSINQNVLANAPCSVGVLLDRGLVKASKLKDNTHNIAMLYFGGSDDREALSYGRRMAEHPNVSLTIFRFLQGDNEVKSTTSNEYKTPLTVTTNIEMEKLNDDEFIKKFLSRYRANKSIAYTETVVNDVNETSEAIQAIDIKHDLYIVGRGHNMDSQLIAGLNEWSEYPELGAIGDLLASTDFGGTMSLLVVQQYTGAGMIDGFGTPTESQMSDRSQSAPFNPMSPSNHV